MYWGELIPIYFPVLFPEGVNPARQNPKIVRCENTINYNSHMAVEESELMSILTKMNDFKLGNNSAGCLDRATDWRYFQKDNNPK